MSEQTSIEVPLSKKGKRELVKICQMLGEELTWYVSERNKYIEALRSIAANTCCDKCQEAALVAKKVLT